MSSARARVVRSISIVALATLFALALLGTAVVGQDQLPGGDAILLGDPRSGHTATLLEDDYVLMAGGFDGEAALATVEVVDPVGMATESLGPLVVARAHHTATLLPDGRVLIAGGRVGDASLADAESYDPLSGESEAIGQMSRARADHDAVPLPDGRVLLVGGVDGAGAVASAELFDPVTGTFTEAAAPTALHVGGAAVALPDGRVLLTGDVAAVEAKATDPADTKSDKKSKKAKKSKKNKKNKDKSGEPAAQPTFAEIYTPETDEWSAVIGGGQFSGHSAVSLSDGLVLLAGGTGTTAELYDPQGGIIATTGSMSRPRAEHAASLLSDGRVLIIGGADSGYELTALEMYDPASGLFEPAGELFVPRTGHSATTLADGRVLIAGGSFAGLTLEDILVYDPRDASLLPLDIDMEVAAEAGADIVDPRTRADIRAQHGPPESFATYYYDEVADDGSARSTSIEEWRYYGAGVEFVFTDDTVATEDPMGPDITAITEPAPYDPDQFSAYMSLAEVVAAAGLEEYIGGPSDESVEGGEVFFGDHLTWGMQDGELRYIEAIALEADDADEEAD